MWLHSKTQTWFTISGMAKHSQPKFLVVVPISVQSESQTNVLTMTFDTCKWGARNDRNTEHIWQVPGGHNKLPNVNSKTMNQYKLIHNVFVLYKVYISGVMNNSFLFAFRCSLTPWLVPVSQNLPSNSQQAVPPRPSLDPPGEDLVCCTYGAVGTSAPSPALHLSLWNIEEAVEKSDR